MTGIRCRDTFQYPTFLLQALLSDAMREEILLKTDSGTILDALNVRSIPRLRLIRPSDAVAGCFEQRVRSLRTQMEIRRAESSSVVRLRDELLPYLLSGKAVDRASLKSEREN